MRVVNDRSLLMLQFFSSAIFFCRWSPPSPNGGRVGPQKALLGDVDTPALLKEESSLMLLCSSLAPPRSVHQQRPHTQPPKGVADARFVIVFCSVLNCEIATTTTLKRAVGLRVPHGPHVSVSTLISTLPDYLSCMWRDGPAALNIVMDAWLVSWAGLFCPVTNAHDFCTTPLWRGLHPWAR